MVKRVLFCASIQGHIRNFHTPYLKLFKEKGYEVHVAGKDNLSNRNLKMDYVDKVYNINFERSPFKLNNIKIYRQLKRIISDNDYDIIHCHTPMAGVLTRLAAHKSRKKGSKTIYTAHGFHFCKGESIKNWIIYYPVEKIMSYYTDCLITINKEDFERAIKGRFKAKKVVKINGVGVNIDKFKPADTNYISELRKKFNYNTEDFLMFYAAEFNINKNQQLLIKVLARLKKSIPNAKLILAGSGFLMDNCRVLAEELGVIDMVDFLGIREDVNQILPMCDLVVASSLREGLPVNIMEAMACAKPIVATSNRGHRELVIEGRNGFLVDSQDELIFENYILQLFNNPQLCKSMGKNSLSMVLPFTLDYVYPQMEKLYKTIENNEN